MVASPAKTLRRRDSLPLRLITALLALPLLLLLAWAGDLWFTFLVLAVVLLGLIEFYRLGPGIGARPVLLLGLFWATLLVFNAHYDTSFGLAIVLGGSFLLSLMWPLTRRPRRGAWMDWFFTLAGPLYLGLTLSHAVWLRQLDHGWEWVLLVLLTVFATDTSAYFVGRAMGRHPMAPTVSPGKTWEGGVGGILGAVGVAVALSFLLDFPLSPWQAVLLGAAAGVVAQVGDLAESALKRAAGVKDTGRLVPGHGGVLDRLDSLVLTFVVVYHSVRWVFL